MKPIAIITACVLALAPLALEAQGNTADTTRRISVKGSAEIAVIPDKITIQFAVTEQGNDIKKIFQSLDFKTKAIIQIAMEQKINPKDILSAEVSILSLRGKEEDGHKIINHEATRKLFVTLDDYSKFDQLLSRFIDAGVNEISSVVRDIKDRPAVQMKAREMAIKAAKAKAEALAASINQTIGKAITIKEDFYDRIGCNYSQELDSDTVFHGSLSVGSVIVKGEVTAEFELK